MIPRKINQSLELSPSLKMRWPIAIVAAMLTGSATASHAEIAPPNARQPIPELGEHVIKFDNSKGTEKLQFRESLRQRQCVATVTPDFFTVAPGETAEVRMDVRDSASSGCQGEPKHVLWNVASSEHHRRPLAYMVLFSVEPKMDEEGRVRIASTKSSRPGTPYAATCGNYACLNEWALGYNDKRQVIYLFNERD
ncbi:hypothetical protein [Trinickia dabaoshanensis]|nr:hypothetical protein [Trinickia dabaoshanensis]